MQLTNKRDQIFATDEVLKDLNPRETPQEVVHQFAWEVIEHCKKHNSLFQRRWTNLKTAGNIERLSEKVFLMKLMGTYLTKRWFNMWLAREKDTKSKEQVVEACNDCGNELTLIWEARGDGDQKVLEKNILSMD